MTEWQVPTVDLSSWVQDGPPDVRARVAADLDRACREVGFLQVVGHGVPDDVIAGLAAAMDAFFGLPAGEKARYRPPSPAVNRGYSPPRSESLRLSLGLGGEVQSAARMNDFFEAFNTGLGASAFPGLDLPLSDYPENFWPEVPGFPPAVETYMAEAGRVARTLTDVFAAALSLPAGFFDAYTDHSIDTFRMNNYALPPGEVTLDGELRGMGEHTDYGIVTVLWADRVPGLQVLGSDGIWHDVVPNEGVLLVNLGDLTARWTNDRWLSTLHRVMPPVVDGTIRRRRSAAFFHDGNVDAVIETLPSCRAADGSTPYPPITAGEHLRAKLAGSRAGVANPETGPEAARLRAAASR